MPTNPTAKTKGNDVADQIGREQIALVHLRVLLQQMSWSQKIAVAQIACNQIELAAKNTQLIKLIPFAGKFDDQLRPAEFLLSSLSPETLAVIAIEILENPNS